MTPANFVLLALAVLSFWERSRRAPIQRRLTWWLCEALHYNFGAGGAHARWSTALGMTVACGGAVKRYQT
jgi:hypothetical protein